MASSCFKIVKFVAGSNILASRSTAISSKLNVNVRFDSSNSSNSNNSSNHMKVTVLGAESNAGRSLALMLKQSTHIDELCLHGNENLQSFAQDLSLIDTKCNVVAFKGKPELKKALQNSNVVVMLAGKCCAKSTDKRSMLENNVPIVQDATSQISKSCPKALIAIATEPINVIVPMVIEMLKKYGHYNPYAVFGITTIDVVRANKFVAEVQGIEPEYVIVPVIGGHTEKTIVPVLSQAKPCAEFTNEELEDITNSVKKANDNLIKVQGCNDLYLSTAFSVARFVMSLVKAFRGHPDIVECAYVKSAAHPQLKYMSTPLLLGPGGVMKNFGVPSLSAYENCLLENAIPILDEEIKLGESLGGRSPHRPDCDPCEPDPNAPRCPRDHCAKQGINLSELK